MSGRGEAAATAPRRGGSTSLLPYLASIHARWLASGDALRWSQDDASLLFADISGFTPLTERLARRGKVGAEELTDLLNAVFTSLLAVAGSFGGDCLKFGGDAVLLHFIGPEHHTRAVEAAHGMLSALRPFRRLRTAAGTVSLGMSIGVHSGAPLIVLGGGSHRELIVAGKATTRTLEAEAAAASGEVRVSAAGAAPLPRRGTGVSEIDPRADLSLGVPLALRDYLSGAPQEGEHRPAAVGFLQCGGTDECLAREGAAATAEAVDLVVRTVQAACDSHGVTFIASDVDKGAIKFVVAAGAPVASADDGLRVVESLAEVVRTPLPLPVRAGVTRGRLFAVDLGSPDRRTFTMIGDSTNLAARIMANAAWQQVWAAANVLERHTGHLSVRPLPPFTVKGKSAPVEAVAVELDESLPRRDEVTEAHRVFGREPELDRLCQLVAQVRAGRGGVAVDVVGDPGIGKSALVATVCRAAVDDGLEAVTFEAGRYSQITSYYPLRFPLRHLLGVTEGMGTGDAIAQIYGRVHDVAPELLPWLPLVGPALGVAIPDTTETERLEPSLRPTRARVTVAGLLRALLPGPSLVLVEDAQWLDSATAGVLAELVAHVETTAWLLLTTRRPDTSPDAVVGTERMILQPLSTAAGLALARDRLDGNVVLLPGAIERIVDRAAGNPLFLHELVSAAADGNLAELPESVEATIAASIDVLPSEDRTLLRWAAVLGVRFPLDVLARMTDATMETLLTRVTRLHRFLQADGDRVRFRQGLTRDVAYEGLSFRRRRELHALAGSILERLRPELVESMAELLSTHFHVAHQYDKSWRYSRIAGEHAERTAAPIEAALFYERAMEAARRLGDVPAADRADVAVRLGDVSELAGRYEQARTAYHCARRLITDDPVMIAELGRRTGVVWEREGRLVEALRTYQRARSGLRGVADRDEADLLLARLSVAYGAARLRQGNYRSAQAELESAVALVGDRRGGDAYRVLAHAYRLLDWIDIELGVERDVPLRNLSLRLYDELEDDFGRANVFNNMGIAAYYLGSWEEAAQLYERSLAAARKAGALVFEALVLNNIAEVRSDQGHLDEAEAMLRQAVEIWRGSNNAMLGMGLGNLGRVAARSGRLDEAERWYDESRQVCTRMKESAMALETDAREAERRLFAGDSAAALLAAADVYERAQQLGGNPYVLMLADRTAGYALAQLGDVRGAWSRIGRSLMRSRENRSDYETALNLQALVRVGHLRGVQVEEFAAESVRLFTGLGVVRTPEVPLPAIQVPEQPRAMIEV